MLARTDASRGHERGWRGSLLKVQFLSPIGEYPGGRETRADSDGIKSNMYLRISESSSMPELSPLLYPEIDRDRSTGIRIRQFEFANLFSSFHSSRYSDLVALAKRTKLFRLKFVCRGSTSSAQKSWDKCYVIVCVMKMVQYDEHRLRIIYDK